MIWNILEHFSNLMTSAAAGVWREAFAMLPAWMKAIAVFLLVLTCPSLFFLVTRLNKAFQFLESSLIKSLHFREDDEGLVGITTEVGDCVAIGITTQGSAMSLTAAFVA